MQFFLAHSYAMSDCVLQVIGGSTGRWHVTVSCRGCYRLSNALPSCAWPAAARRALLSRLSPAQSTLQPCKPTNVRLHSDAGAAAARRAPCQAAHGQMQPKGLCWRAAASRRACCNLKDTDVRLHGHAGAATARRALCWLPATEQTWKAVPRRALVVRSSLAQG